MCSQGPSRQGQGMSERGDEIPVREAQRQHKFLNKELMVKKTTIFTDINPSLTDEFKYQVHSENYPNALFGIQPSTP